MADPSARALQPGQVIGMGFLLLSWVIPFIALLMPHGAAMLHSWVLYAAQLSVFLALWNRTGTLSTLLSPAALIILYVDASFLLGNFAFGRGLVLHQGNLEDFKAWRHLDLANFYMLLQCVFIYHVDVYFRVKREREKAKPVDEIPASARAALGGIALTFLVLFSVVPFDVEFLGGSGDMAVVPKTMSVLVLSYMMARSGSAWRFLAYATILLVFAAFSYTNKRDAIFLIFPTLLVEAILYRRRLGMGAFASGCLLAIFLAALIILMSIMRGYGGFEVDSAGILTLVPFILRYIQLEDFLPYFFNNIETNYTYFHSIQAIEYVLEDPALLTYGSTILKSLFISIPASVIAWKPDSFIDLYTTLHDPAFRAAGGSWPPNALAEMFWNFHFLGLAALPAIVAVFSAIHYRVLEMIRNGAILTHAWLLFAYMQIMTWARGSGMDMLLIYVLFGAAFSYLYIFILQALGAGSRCTCVPAEDSRPTEAST